MTLSQMALSQVTIYRQICSHTPSALNAGAKRSGATCHYGHASMLLLGEGSEATEPYNKYDKIRPHSIRSQQFDQKVRPLSFRPEKFDLFTATHTFRVTKNSTFFYSFEFLLFQVRAMSSERKK